MAQSNRAKAREIVRLLRRTYNREGLKKQIDTWTEIGMDAARAAEDIHVDNHALRDRELASLVVDEIEETLNLLDKEEEAKKATRLNKARELLKSYPRQMTRNAAIDMALMRGPDVCSMHIRNDLTGGKDDIAYTLYFTVQEMADVIRVKR